MGDEKRERVIHFVAGPGTKEIDFFSYNEVLAALRALLPEEEAQDLTKQLFRTRIESTSDGPSGLADAIMHQLALTSEDAAERVRSLRSGKVPRPDC
jgi:hypothetical protein